MKKTFPVNINGKIYYIDEDAYILLRDYLAQLHATFTGDEGDEIVSDIEQRISEHFDERLSLGANVIVIDDVNRVIEIMGRPEQISGDSGDSGRRTPPAAPGSAQDDKEPDTSACPPPINKRLYRDVRHKVLGGVIAGLAQYLGWDATIMRILAVVLACCTYFWPCTIIYLVTWMVIPVARTPREILEMQGQPVTLGNIGQTVINNASAPNAPVPGDNPSSFSSLINTFFSIAAKLILGFFGLIAGVTAFALCCIIIAAICGIATLHFAGSAAILDGLDFYNPDCPILSTWGVVCILTAVMIPCIAIVWAACSVLFKAKSPSKSAIFTIIIIEIIIIVAATVLCALAENGDYGITMIPLPTAQAAASGIAAIPVMAMIAPSISA